jgi:aerobic-type carbon monoxide dehydrogenase small subunit (CoxS/CutS family)
MTMPQPTDQVHIELKVNGEGVTATVPARRTLVDFLREDLSLTGTHIGCEQGVCGSCTILLDGVAVRSCLMLAAQADSSEVRTVESLAEGDALSPMQAAFKETHALQCGFCTPGFLMTLSAADPSDYTSDDEIRELLGGNVCRCTGYHNIVAAVRLAWGRDGH